MPATGNLTDDVVRHAAEAPHAVLFSPAARRATSTWDDVTAAAFHAEVRGVAKGLLAAGVEPGDRVALISRTRYEWTLLDYAIWYAGAVGVPIYETSTPEQVRWILLDSGACAVVAEGPAHLARIAEVRADRRTCGMCGRSRTTRSTCSPGSAPTSATTPSRPACGGDPARPGHHHLHLGDDRPTQGLLLTHGNL